MGMRGNGTDSQMVVTVRKDKLIEILTENRAKHVEEYNQAVAIYRKRVAEKIGTIKEALTTWLIEFEKNPHKEVTYPEAYLRLPQPKSYEDSYTRTLGMLGLHTGETLTIDQDTYRQYVDDEWEWKAQSKMSNASYLSG
jgi:hypothetical protein